MTTSCRHVQGFWSNIRPYSVAKKRVRNSWRLSTIPHQADVRLNPATLVSTALRRCWKKFCLLPRWFSTTPGNKGRPVDKVMYLEIAMSMSSISTSAPFSGVTVIPVQTSRDLCRLLVGTCSQKRFTAKAPP